MASPETRFGQGLSTNVGKAKLFEAEVLTIPPVYLSSFESTIHQTIYLRLVSVYPFQYIWS